MAGNFSGHKFVKTGVEALTKKGFSVGTKVVVVKRFTVDYDPAKPNVCRKDVVLGTECFIKGYVPDTSDDTKSKLVFNFEAKFGKALKSVDVAIDPAKFKLADDGADDTADNPKGKKKPDLQKVPFPRNSGRRSHL